MVDLGVENERRPTLVISFFWHFSVFRRIGVTCPKLNPLYVRRRSVQFGASFELLLPQPEGPRGHIYILGFLSGGDIPPLERAIKMRSPTS